MVAIAWASVSVTVPALDQRLKLQQARARGESLTPQAELNFLRIPACWISSPIHLLLQAQPQPLLQVPRLPNRMANLL